MSMALWQQALHNLNDRLEKTKFQWSESFFFYFCLSKSFNWAAYQNKAGAVILPTLTAKMFAKPTNRTNIFNKTGGMQH